MTKLDNPPPSSYLETHPALFVLHLFPRPLPFTSQLGDEPTCGDVPELTGAHSDTSNTVRLRQSLSLRGEMTQKELDYFCPGCWFGLLAAWIQVVFCITSKRLNILKLFSKE